MVASGNRHKFEELTELFSPERVCAGIELELRFGGEYEPGPGEIEEDGDTYEANALIKARAWADFTGLPAIADDSGIEVSALGGAPGIHSARAASGSDADRAAWLLERMNDEQDRRARFVACIVVAFPGCSAEGCEKNYFSSTGICEGELARASHGDFGFGYDPIFVPVGYDKSFSELGADVKMRISHRARAAKGMVLMLGSVIKYASHCANGTYI